MHSTEIDLRRENPSRFCVFCSAPDNKPAIVFVPSRKQSQLTAIDMITYAAADGHPDRFLTVDEAYMVPVVETIEEPALQQTLGHGVGFIHQGMLEADRKRVEGLYRDGVIKVRWCMRESSPYM